MIDNSWASPVFQQPITLGVDLVLHSASKYLGGHSDVVAGVVAGSNELVARLRGEALSYLGGKLGPFDAWLLTRGLRTLHARMKTHEASALEIGRRLSAHDAVTKVCHPGLKNHLPPGLTGTSGLFSFHLSEKHRRENLLRPPRTLQARRQLGRPRKPDRARRSGSGAKRAQPNSAHAFGMSPRSVRIHVGLEGTEALWRDLEAALAAAKI